ncbi:transcriptional enhancer factor TEF-5 [Vulpes lagopus]|uniref:transcriptional enhancer factor TEF-5 n=1 Tax=Vulpes lagopus TaxID=494514 RepID=UPI001BCA21B5|nr:transcriptional enhancer factor TEF-5 [Vulpes lagopus]
MREEEPAPTSPIKPRPGPASSGGSARAENQAAGGVRRAGPGPASPPPAPLPPRPGALPRPLPRAQRRSYRNSAGSWCRDAPRGGPGPRGRAPEVREEGEREKFEKQASRGEPDKPGPGRAGAVARPGRGLGPRELGAGSRAGEGAAPRRLGTGWQGGLGSPEARAPWLRGAPRDAAPRRESSRVAGAPPPAPPRPEPQTARRRGRPRAAPPRPAPPRPARRGPPPARPAPSFPSAPTPRPGSSTQTFRPARSLLRARRLPLQPGSFHTFRPAPSPRPPFPGPPLSSSGPGGAARPERPPELGPGSGCPVGSGPEPRATSTIASNSWNASSSPGEAREDGPEGLDKGLDNDAEGVWSPDIEQSFQEALAIYPPCGRRKIILSDEGKMYGRNELIARYIKLRTGKTRTRKQVSSHLQVLARRKSREIQSKLKAMNLDQVSKDKALQSMASMSSAQIVSASVLQNKFSPPSPLPQAVFSTSSRFWSSPPLLGQQPGPSQDIKPFAQPAYPIQPPLPPTLSSYEPLTPLPPAAASAPVWQDRTIASSRLRLLEYSAFMEVQRDPDTYSKHLFVHIGQTNPAFSDPPLEAVDVRQIYDKFPEKKGGLKELYEKGPPNAFFLVKFWADLNSTIQEGPGAFYGVSSQYSSTDSMTISVSTKVCSFGKQVVEKVETEYARLENGRFVYRIHRSPMCEYMINFIHKLKHLPEKYMMNSVLENFTILQVVTSRDSQETLLVIAFVFEVSTSEHGAQHHVYKLVKD